MFRLVFEFFFSIISIYFLYFSGFSNFFLAFSIFKLIFDFFWVFQFFRFLISIDLRFFRMNVVWMKYEQSKYEWSKTAQKLRRKEKIMCRSTDILHNHGQFCITRNILLLVWGIEWRCYLMDPFTQFYEPLVSALIICLLVLFGSFLKFSFSSYLLKFIDDCKSLIYLLKLCGLAGCRKV